MSSKKAKSNRSRTRQFTSDLKAMLYAFGDTSSPHIDTINFLEDVLSSYLIDVIEEANRHRIMVQRNKFRIEDLKFALRRDPVKLGRVADLELMDREISKAKKQFDDLDGSKAKNVDKDTDGASMGVTMGGGLKRKIGELEEGNNRPKKSAKKVNKKV